MNFGLAVDEITLKVAFLKNFLGFISVQGGAEAN